MKSSTLAILAAGALLAPGATLPAQVQVPYQRIANAGQEPANWLTYSGNYAGHRYSTLAEITPANVAQLRATWVFQSRDAGSKWECTPLVVDGMMYVSEASNVITAIDARTGRSLWTYRRPLPTDVPGCCGPVNRGVAILGDAVYVCTYDAHLVCIDANSGKERWDVRVADYKVGHSITVAPLAVKDKIIVGMAGGDYAIRGFLDAYDAATGALAWRFWTIPGPGEPHHESWGLGGESWKKGGTATWVTGTYDPELNTLYWGTGNPAPDFNDDDRPGDNLYSDCVLAINPDTGKLRWHFQYTPHDVHDWDSNQVPVLIDADVDGKARKLLVQANRNAFFYVLDRTSGRFITGREFGKQTWARGLDELGRPIVLPNTAPTAEGVLVYPSLGGVVNWASPSYSPQTKLFYVQASEDSGQIFFKLKPNEETGQIYMGGAARAVFDREPYGMLKAIDPTSGGIRWEFRQQTAVNCGVLSTASGLVFSGTRQGQLFALDAKSGALLWQFTAGGQIASGPITYLVDGRQHVAVTAGQGLFVFAIP